VAGVLLGELIILIVAALPIGLLFGRGLAILIIEKVRTETVRLPLEISLFTYTVSVLVVVAAACSSFIVVGRMLRKLDMVGVLKARD
jgi:putative ABC transport system permease protein